MFREAINQRTGPTSRGQRKKVNQKPEELMGFVISFSFHVYISILIVEARDEQPARDRSRLVVPQYLVWPICSEFK